MTKPHMQFVLEYYITELEDRGFISERNPENPLNHILWMCHQNIEYIDKNKSDRKI